MLIFKNNKNAIIKIDCKSNNKCRYGNYTRQPFTGCKTCGGMIVECSHEKVWPKQRNSKTCNSTCKEFKI
jgi:hypothetical protein